jgi:hypothetical protein
MKHSHAVALVFVSAAASLAQVAPSFAQPTYTEVLEATDFSATEIHRIFAGDIVSGDLKAVSERDLAVSLAFLVKASPGELAKRVLEASLREPDEGLTARGEIGKAGSIEDFAGLHLVPGGSEVAQAYVNAKAGGPLNLATAEIASFNALKSKSDPTKAVEQQLRTMLLARYRAYRKSGLDGIEPYDRGGKAAPLVADLRSASEAPLLKKFLPEVQKVLADYPRATVPGLSENFFWVNNKIENEPTVALMHVLAAPEGDARILVQRHFYVGRNYDVAQAVAAFIPIEDRTLVVYASHFFVDGATTFRASAPQSLRRRVLGGKLKELLEQARAEAAKN